MHSTDDDVGGGWRRGFLECTLDDDEFLAAANVWLDCDETTAAAVDIENEMNGLVW